MGALSVFFLFKMCARLCCFSCFAPISWRCLFPSVCCFSCRSFVPVPLLCFPVVFGSPFLPRAAPLVRCRLCLLLALLAVWVPICFLRFLCVLSCASSPQYHQGAGFVFVCLGFPLVPGPLCVSSLSFSRAIFRQVLPRCRVSGVR